MIVSAVRCAVLAFALLLVAAPAQSEVIKNDVYRFTLNKPDGWHDVSPQALSDHSRPVGNEGRASVAQTSAATVLAFSRLKEPTPELNSTFIMMGARVGPAAQSVSPITAMDGALRSVFQTGAKVSVASPSQATKVGGLPAAHARLYIEAMNDGKLHHSENEMWVVLRGESLLIIQIQAKRGDKKAGMDKLRAAVRSIRFAR